MVTYVRDFGGYTLTASEMSELQTLRDALATAMDNPAQRSDVGLGVPVYSYIYNLATVQTTSTDVSTGLSQTITVPKPGVDAGVVIWLSGARDVNNQQGLFSDFIREYTKAQYEIRGPSVNSQPGLDINAKVQEASNYIALRLAEDICGIKESPTKQGTNKLPGIMSIAVIDAGESAATIFKHTGFDEYAPWAGTLLLPFLSPSANALYRDLLLSWGQLTATIPLRGNTLEIKPLQIKYAIGTYDLVASLQASEVASNKAGLSHLGSAILNLFGPNGVPYPNQDVLIAETTKSFNEYYGLKPGTFNLGADVALNPGWRLAFDNYDYFAGTYTDDVLDSETLVKANSAFDSWNTAIMNGGYGSDEMRGSPSPDLLDGGPGNDKLNALEGNDYLFGDLGDDTLDGGEGDDQLNGGEDNDAYVFAGSFDRIKTQNQSNLLRKRSGYTETDVVDAEAGRGAEAEGRAQMLRAVDPTATAQHAAGAIIIFATSATGFIC